MAQALDEPRLSPPGFPGIDHELFLYDNTVMAFGNAKTTVQKITQALENY